MLKTFFALRRKLAIQRDEEKEPAYVDAVAREWASEPCFRCSNRGGWKTAALIYEGLEWKYYRCYECRQWFKRHFRYRYVVSPVDDAYAISLLVKKLELEREILEASMADASWIRKKLTAASNFFQRFLPQGQD